MELIITVLIVSAALARLAAVSAQLIETGSRPELSINYLISHLSPPALPAFRLPPTFFNPPRSPGSWEATPPDWMLGTWYFYASNQATYTTFFRDMQWTLDRIAYPNNSRPTDQLHDLVTYFLAGDEAGNTTLHYSYGIDTPLASLLSLPQTSLPDIYHSEPNPPLTFANNTWAVTAWGYDADGVPYAVLYETPAAGQSSASIDFVSRRRRGISAQTFEWLKAGVRALGSTELDALMANVSVLEQDSARDGTAFPECNATCMTNAYSVTVIPQSS